MKSNEKQQRRELLQEQLLKYEDFGSDGKLHKVDISWSAQAYWSGEIEVGYLDITKEDIVRGLTEEQCNDLSSAFTEENLQYEGLMQCDKEIEFGHGSEGIEVDCDLMDL
mgnify:CR=1 FL=1